jgi:energy-coupling factor transport system ATP-binding protein
MDTVTREIGFGLANYGVANQKERIANAIVKAGLEPFASRPPQSLSRGQRQRVAVASILAMEPSVLVLDEPTTGQDRGHLKALLDDMVCLHHQGRTVLLITHDLTLVASFADRVLVLDAGRLLFDGTPSDLFYRSPVLLELEWEPPITIRLCRTLGLPPHLSPEDLVPAGAPCALSRDESTKEV